MQQKPGQKKYLHSCSLHLNREKDKIYLKNSILKFCMVNFKRSILKCFLDKQKKKKGKKGKSSVNKSELFLGWNCQGKEKDRLSLEAKYRKPS